MSALRRWLAVIVLLGLLSGWGAQANASDCHWPAWEQFKSGFIEAGRVVDRSDARAVTTSEGQAYGMFFALVAGDQETFRSLLLWTQRKLAQEDLSQHLPAWLWGRAEDGAWRILDENSASDADLWIAYSLEQAGRLWKVRDYRSLSTLLLLRIEAREVVQVEGLGPLLLPAPQGFAGEQGLTFNPSYLPLSLLQSFAVQYPDSAWARMEAPTLRLLKETAPQGYAPNWVRWHEQRWQPVEKEGGIGSYGIGSYDAVRIYLWAGMMASGTAGRDHLLAQLRPMLEYTRLQGAPPQRFNALTGKAEGEGPVGFSAALLPLLASLGEEATLQTQLARIKAMPPGDNAYYDQVLSLFGTGWQEGRFRFNAQGALELPDQAACAH